jgi:2-oxoglutarate ferredoxin oxidoreductase subunit delta
MAEKKRKLHIDRERCKGCLFCVQFCPGGALAVSKSVNKKGLRYVELVDEDKCTGCGMCFMMCPDCVIEIKHED